MSRAVRLGIACILCGYELQPSEGLDLGDGLDVKQLRGVPSLLNLLIEPPIPFSMPESRFRCPVDFSLDHPDQSWTAWHHYGARPSDLVRLGKDRFLPCFIRGPDTPSKADVAIIVIHGAPRNNAQYFNTLGNGVDNFKFQERSGSTVIVSPVFPDRNCSAADWSGDVSAVGSSPMWSRGTRHWVNGLLSDSDGDWEGISSFEALDILVDTVQVMYPQLRRVVITGFSSGAQMLLRWAVTSAVGVNGVTDRGVPLFIVMGSPSSVIYLDTIRPAHKCLLDDGEGAKHVCASFLKPRKGSGRSQNETAKICKGNWNKYPFGLQCLQPKKYDRGTPCGDVGSYVRKGLAEGEKVKTALPLRFASKELRFAIGDIDTKNCLLGACSHDCSAMQQGPNRLKRVLNFMEYLRNSSTIASPIFGVFEGGHSADNFYPTDLFLDWAYGDLPPRSTNHSASDPPQKRWNDCYWYSWHCWSTIRKVIVATLSSVAIVAVGFVAVFCIRTQGPQEEEQPVVELQTI